MTKKSFRKKNKYLIDKDPKYSAFIDTLLQFLALGFVLTAMLQVYGKW